MDKATKVKWDLLEIQLRQKDTNYRTRGIVRLGNSVPVKCGILASKTEAEIQEISRQLLASMV